MVNHLYKNFLSSIEEYKACESFWRDLCETILLKHQGITHGWMVWLNVIFLDGNPMYSLISPDSRKGIAIYQHEPTENKIIFGAWMDKFGPIDTTQDFVEEIVIACELSQESASVASELIEIWVEGNSSYENMEILIQEKISSL
ncbi:hypothetical protein Riv7116_3781 [Rivularia sp. PCC 7116]|uniref:hypothetical protein n=1 Tax=Rivularia sp. PCC 7116 TaxID=373994 RepID=UPI00029F354E|nr:hypothetical protein [Rivularia sp. PCC 7116]AFY56225.1 hypothetical protein Riv7116_3781 [Rivularia sp. PCC 7116]